MIAARFRKLQQTTARLLLTLALLPTGPVMGMGAVAPTDLGLQVTEYRPEEHYEAVKDKWFGLRTPDGR